VAETFFGDFGEFLWSDKNPQRCLHTSKDGEKNILILKSLLTQYCSYSGEKMASNEVNAAEIKLLQDIALNFVCKFFTETP
jgi:hypothetical protein